MEWLIRILLFCFGLLIGHWLAIGRDKRKEFNDAAEIIFQKLIEEKGVKNDPTPHRKGISENELISFLRFLPFFKKKSYKKAYDTYIKSKNEENRNVNGYGECSYKDPSLVVNSINSLLKFTERR